MVSSFIRLLAVHGLRECGHEVKLVDAPAYNLDHKTTETIVSSYKPDWLVVYTGRISEDNDIAIADKLTEKNWL